MIFNVKSIISQTVNICIEVYDQSRFCNGTGSEPVSMLPCIVLTPRITLREPSLQSGPALSASDLTLVRSVLEEFYAGCTGITNIILNI